MSEEKLMEVRRQKHLDLNEGAYPLAVSRGAKIRIILAGMNLNEPAVSLNPDELGEHTLYVHGRISAIRKSGGITFIKVFDSTAAVQLIASKSVLSDYPNLGLLDLGDIIEVEGKPCMSKTGEYSILILTWKVLTKSHRSPPEKYIGITNVETKYRKRYLDLMSSEESRAVFVTRSHVLRALRDFMESNDFIEVETSTLNSVSSGANAKPFVTHHNALDADLFLRIAPELYLKRLLVGGLDKVFEIGRNYRNEGLSTRHNPEFTMLEFYETYATFDKLIDYTKRMLAHVEQFLDDDMYKSFAFEYVKQWREQRSFTLSYAREMTMWAAIQLAAMRSGMTINKDLSIKIDNLDHPRLLRVDLAKMLNDLESAVLYGEKVFVLFEHLAEPFLTEDYTVNNGEKTLSVPVFITEYPAEICPLARRNDDNPDVCDRFELFVNGKELCNAFQELNDPDEQAHKFQDQQESNQKDPMGYDADYVEALEYGMPPAIGFGMGIDRLVMLLTNSQSIKDVILFPTLKTV